MQFSQTFFTIVSLFAISQAAAIPPSSSVITGNDGDGIMDGLCDQVANRFYKFGQCISSTPQFNSLNSTFWYQAARSELCGYPVSFTPPPPAVQLNLSSIAYGKSNAQTDVQLELQAEYFYLMRTTGANATTTTDIEFSAATNEYMDPEKRGFGLASFALPQCLNACNIIQKYSNVVEPCWEVTGLTVLYGVCEVGCRYYF